MPLSTAELLASVVAPFTAEFGSLDRLAIDTPGARRRISPGLHPHLLAKGVEDHLPGAVIPPLGEDHDQQPVRLLAIKFLGLAGSNAKEALPASERLREDPSAEARKQAEAASEQIKKSSAFSQEQPAPQF
jgi:hypothetical protein